MLDINIKNLKHNPKAINNVLKQTSDLVLAKDDLMVLFPAKFINKELAIVGSTVRVVSILCIIDSKNNYAVMTAPIYSELTPDKIDDTVIDGELYKVLHFPEDSVFMNGTKLVMSDNFLYDLFDMFYTKGEIPFYLDYENASEIFLESKKYCGNNIGGNSCLFEIITAIVGRNDKNKTEYWRHVLNQKKKGCELYYVGLSDIYYAFDNTGSKLIGAYFEQGLVNAVSNKETKPTNTVKVLRY